MKKYNVVICDREGYLYDFGWFDTHDEADAEGIKELERVYAKASAQCEAVHGLNYYVEELNVTFRFARMMAKDKALNVNLVATQSESINAYINAKEDWTAAAYILKYRNANKYDDGFNKGYCETIIYRKEGVGVELILESYWK